MEKYIVKTDTVELKIDKVRRYGFRQAFERERDDPSGEPCAETIGEFQTLEEAKIFFEEIKEKFARTRFMPHAVPYFEVTYIYIENVIVEYNDIIEDYEEIPDGVFAEYVINPEEK